MSESKSELIRQIGREIGPSARPKDVIARLAERGVAVTSSQVSTVLASMNKNSHKHRPAELTLDSLLAAKQLVTQLGSIEAAKAAVDALAKLS